MTTTQRTGDIDRALPQQRPAPAAPPGPAPVPPPGAPLPTPVVLAPPRPARRDVLAIRASLSAVQQRPVLLAETFYAHLFDIAPVARAMFGEDMTAQMQRMIDFLLRAIGALQDGATPGATSGNDALERSLRALGAVHRDRWNVQPEHYLYIAHALTRAVRDVAGPAWSGSLSSSWIALSQWATGHMLVGHHGPPVR